MVSTAARRPVLVFGASGLAGSAIVAEAARRAMPVVGTYGSVPVAGLERWQGDPGDAAALIERVRPVAVVYAAGYTHVDGCEARPDEAVRLNAETPAALARESRGTPFVYLSTEYVFDGLAGPYAETASIRPLSAYGRSKAEGERRVLAEHPEALVLRTTVLYGPDHQGKSFVAQLRHRLGQRERMRVPDDQISTPTFTEDLAARMFDLIDQRAGGIWHVTGPEAMDRHAFARIAAEAFGLDARLLEPCATATLGQVAPRPLRAGLRIEKLEAACGQGCMRAPAEALAQLAAAERAAVDVSR